MTGWILLAGALALLLAQAVTVGLYIGRLRPRASAVGPMGQPRITLMRPVCGLDPQDAETLGSSFQQAYPDYEIIFCAPSDDDPAVPLVRRLIAAHPQVPARLMTGQTRITGNPKLDNLWKGWPAARGDYVCMADSNLLLPPDYLATLMATWTPGTGLVSSPAWGARPANFAASLECAFLNGNQARLQFAADSLGQGFAQGKTLFWNRRMLDGAGGLRALGGWLAEDVAATRLVRGLGLKVRLAPLPFAQPIGRRSLRQVWDRQLRWSRVRRDGFPLIFATEFANGPLAATAVLAAGLSLTGLSWALLPLFLAMWYGSEVLLIRRAGWPAGARDLAALPVRDALLPLLWLATFLRRDITWRGTAMAAPARDAVADQREADEARETSRPAG